MPSGLLLNQPLALYVILVFGLFAVWFLFLRSSIPRDIREPVLIRPRIPIIGHAISLLLHGSDYYEKIRSVASLQGDFQRMRLVLIETFKGENLTPNLHARGFRAQHLRCE